MKTILIPTDFSETAHNATRYAVEIANEVNAQKIILYNAYSMPLTTEMSFALLESEELKKNSEDGLAEVKKLIAPLCKQNIEIKTISDFGFLGQRINEIVEQEKADLIVMGITGGGKLEQMLIGSNTISVMHHIKTPLLIVPPKSKWQAIKKIAWVCDYHNIKQTTPISFIHQLLKLTHAELHVIHNEPKYKHPDPEVIFENVELRELFKQEKPIFSFLEEKDFTESINHYMDINQIDWLIIVPKKHGWLSGIFTSEHTKQMAFHTHVPMLCLQQ